MTLRRSLARAYTGAMLSASQRHHLRDVHLDDARRDSTGLYFGTGTPYVAVRWCGDVDSTSKATQSFVLESFLRVRLNAPDLAVIYR